MEKGEVEVQDITSSSRETDHGLPPPPGDARHPEPKAQATVADETLHQDDNGRPSATSINTREGTDGHQAGGESDAGGTAGRFPALSAAQKARAARECKRLLDVGRMEFVEEQLGLRAEVVHFVERDVTPENALLLGFRL